MSDWVSVIAESALAVGERLVVDLEGVEVAIFRLEDGLYALEDICTHDGAEIASGEKIEDEIVCPRHGARFCIKTGEVRCAPAYENIAKIDIRIEAGRIEIRDTRWD